jgi:apolipoprotein D and lipocalin family protein
MITGRRRGALRHLHAVSLLIHAAIPVAQRRPPALHGRLVRDRQHSDVERGAHNAVESYRLDRMARLRPRSPTATGSFDGTEKVMRPRGFVRDPASNAAWGMQFIWPIKAEYLIAHVDADYRETIIARSRRDYVWIMARAPTLPDADYARLARKVADPGYDTSKLLKVPQRW